MEKETLFKRLKVFISGVAWKVFIWGIDLSEDEYWNRIYEQEKALLNCKTN